MAFIEAKEIKIKDLLSHAQEAYKVPVYQRAFAWTETQWRELFEDLTQLTEDEIHFLGSIVVVPTGPHRHGINYFEIVDGQQRMATILILLAVIRDLSREKGNHGFANYINDTFLFAKDWEGDKEIKVPKLELGKLDNEAFQSILEQKHKDSSNLVFNCYNFFKKNIQSSGNDLQKLVNTILNKVSIVHINALNYLNAFRLFETLNDRGLELSATDLIKNYLLSKVAGDEDIFNMVVDEWNEMYEKVRDLEPVKFVRRYMLSSYSGKISERRLYEGLKNKIEREEGGWNNTKIYGFVKNLNKHATIYKNIYHGIGFSEKINNRLKELHLVEVAPSYTLLLKIMSAYEEKIIPEDDIIKILDMIEVFHIRWGICGQATSRLDDVYNAICVGLGNITERTNVLKIITDIYRQEFNTLTDQLFYNNFLKGSFKASETRTKYILWKLSQPTGETLLNINEIQTEHIMPQKLNKDWIQYLKNKTKMKDDEILEAHAKYLNRIGNLTIIKGDWNSKMSNRVFNIKKEDYQKSDISITKKLSEYNEWGFEEIERRSEELATLAVSQIWKWKW